MKKLDFNMYKSLLIDHFRTNLENFAKTVNNKEVYAVVLDSHATYGTVNMRWNTVFDFEKRVEKFYASYTEDRLNGISGVKYSVGDFYYEDSIQPNEIKTFGLSYDETITNYFDNEDDHSLNELMEKFINVLVEILDELKPTLSLLNKTDNFIAYIVEHDEDVDTYIRRTVTIEEYYRAFPEIKEYDHYLEIIYSLPKEKQVIHWCGLLSDFLSERDTEEVRLFKQMYRTEFDVEGELVKLGSIAADNVVNLFEVYSGYIPTGNGTIIQSTENTRWTFLSILIEIKSAEEGTIERLKNILIRKYEIDNEMRECVNIARTLHALDSSRFPEEEHDKGRLRLLNLHEYKAN